MKTTHSLGQLDLSDLSPLVHLTELIISLNKFTGNPDLTVLPKGMISAWMEHNELSGDICLTQLPPELQRLDLSNNSLTGAIDLRFLPETLYSLYMNISVYT